jgi:hypothetical protein
MSLAMTTNNNLPYVASYRISNSVGRVYSVASYRISYSVTTSIYDKVNTYFTIVVLL